MYVEQAGVQKRVLGQREIRKRTMAYIFRGSLVLRSSIQSGSSLKLVWSCMSADPSLHGSGSMLGKNADSGLLSPPNVRLLHRGATSGSDVLSGGPPHVVRAAAGNFKKKQKRFEN
jgi:hypothetical protein